MKLNPTAASILGFLQNRPKTGYELLDVIERSVGNFWHTTKSQVYADLKRLESAGYIEIADATGARNQRVCSITEPGRDAFLRWIHKAPPLERVRNPLALSVFFRESINDDPHLLAVVRDHRRQHQARLEVYRALQSELRPEPRGPLLTVRLGIRYEEAMIGWMDEVEAALVS